MKQVSNIHQRQMTSLKVAKATYIKTDIGRATVVKETTAQGSLKVLRSVVRAGVKPPPRLYGHSHQRSPGLYIQNPNRLPTPIGQVNNAVSSGLVPPVHGNIPVDSNGGGNSGSNISTVQPTPSIKPTPSNAGVTGASDYAALAKNSYKGEETVGYVIDPFLSDTEATVYVDSSGKAILSFKGTQPTDSKEAPSDLAADYHIVRGVEQHSYEFEHALIHANKVIKKYGVQNVVAVGHSLGGTKAMYVSHMLGIHAEVFNAGWSPADVFRHSFTIPKWAWAYNQDERPEKWNLSNVKSHIILGDAVSNTALLQPGLKVKIEGGSEGLAKSGMGIAAKTAIGVGVTDVVGSIVAGMGAGPVGVAAAVATATIVGLSGITHDMIKAHDMSNFVPDKKLKSQQKAFVSHPLGGYDIGASRSHGNAWGFA